MKVSGLMWDVVPCILLALCLPFTTSTSSTTTVDVMTSFDFNCSSEGSIIAIKKMDGSR